MNSLAIKFVECYFSLTAKKSKQKKPRLRGGRIELRQPAPSRKPQVVCRRNLHPANASAEAVIRDGL